MIKKQEREREIENLISRAAWWKRSHSLHGSGYNLPVLQLHFHLLHSATRLLWKETLGMPGPLVLFIHAWCFCLLSTWCRGVTGIKGCLEYMAGLLCDSLHGLQSIPCNACTFNFYHQSWLESEIFLPAQEIPAKQVQLPLNLKKKSELNCIINRLIWKINQN